MKLSERIRDSRAGTSNLADAIAALEAELDAAYQANRDLIARADRLRVERDAAQAFNEIALDRATQVRGRAERESAEAVAIIHLVYEMREHALRGLLDLARMYIGELVGERDASKHEMTYMRERAERAEAERDARPIPPVALEASDGGNRQAEAAKASAPKCVLCRKPNPDWFVCSTCRSASDYEGDFSNQTEGAPTLAEIKARQADNDLARRRVTERACTYCEPHDEPCNVCNGPSCECEQMRDIRTALACRPGDELAAIVERDARIATLERERDEALGAIGRITSCPDGGLGPWTRAEAILAHDIAADPTKSTSIYGVTTQWTGEIAENAERAHRTKAADSAPRLLRQVLPWVRSMTELLLLTEAENTEMKTLLAHRVEASRLDEAIARAERAEHSVASLEKQIESTCEIAESNERARAFQQDRAERLEAVIAKVHVHATRLRDHNVSCHAIDFLAILDEGKV